MAITILQLYSSFTYNAAQLFVNVTTTNHPKTSHTDFLRNLS